MSVGKDIRKRLHRMVIVVKMEFVFMLGIEANDAAFMLSRLKEEYFAT